ncbi:MAG: phospholipase D-like domain-containing protein, partial [Candidatus Gastranaerophilales bacterium]
KKVVLLSSLIALTNFITPTNCAEISVPQAQETYKVLKVIDGDTMYIDFNRDGYYQKDEKVRLNGIDTFEVKPSYWLDNQMKQFNFTQTEALGLGYYGKEFAKKNLLDKAVVVKFSTNPTTEKETSDLIKNDTEGVSPTPKGQEIGTKTLDVFNRELVSIYFTDGRSYEQEVLKQGLATVYEKSNLAPQLKEYESLDEVYKNSEKARKLDLVLLNKKNGKYHKPTCKYGQMASNAELIQKPNFLSEYKPSSCCFDVKPEKKKEYKYYDKIVKPDVKQGNIELYFLSPLKQKEPVNECVTNACKALLYEIDQAKSSIDFAIYGIAGQDSIFNALVEAQKRGVKIRWVTDMTEHNTNIYFDTYKLMKQLPNYKTDYESTASHEIPDYKYKLDYQGGIMHDKFFIFDNEKVFTGSTNISSTCLTGYNSNVALLINSEKVAKVYLQEFEQMYSGKFHTDKIAVKNNENIFLNDTELSIYFSPANKISQTKIIPIIKNAKHYIYIPIFYLTHYDIIQGLIEAKKRGVEVKIIVDQTSVEGKYVKIDHLQKNNIDIKVENWAGKMHQKSMIIDDDILIIGSMNFTKHGEYVNDENTIIIKNSTILTKSYKQHFLELWNSLK